MSDTPDCGHRHRDRHTIWAYRLALAYITGSDDAYFETGHEVEHDGCIGCVLTETQGILLGAIVDMHEQDYDAAVAWLQNQLDAELARIENDA